MKFHVDPDRALQLNLRAGPQPATIKAVLPAETNLIKVSQHPTKSVWWKVDADLNGSTVQGYVHSHYLKSGHVDDISPVQHGSFPEAHLKKNSVLRKTDGGRAFPLHEPNMPERSSASGSQVVSIIKYLEPDKSAHKRYIATAGKTFCNIYAYDYACRCGVYIPRVWWTDKALLSIGQGQTPPINTLKPCVK